MSEGKGVHGKGFCVTLLTNKDGKFGAMLREQFVREGREVDGEFGRFADGAKRGRERGGRGGRGGGREGEGEAEGGRGRHHHQNQYGPQSGDRGRPGDASTQGERGGGTKRPRWEQQNR